jgi:hypothetical protein
MYTTHEVCQSGAGSQFAAHNAMTWNTLFILLLACLAVVSIEWSLLNSFIF